MRNENGFALITVLMLSVFGVMLVIMASKLTSEGIKTFQAASSYFQAYEFASSCVEQAITAIETTPYSALGNTGEKGHLGPISPQWASENSDCEIWRVVKKPVFASGRAVEFPPKSSDYTSISGTLVSYLICSKGKKDQSAAELYVMYQRGY